MSALFWKEIREKAKWALLAMVVLGVMESIAVRTDRNQLYTFDFAGISLCRTSFLMVTNFGAPPRGFCSGCSRCCRNCAGINGRRCCTGPCRAG